MSGLGRVLLIGAAGLALGAAGKKINARRNRSQFSKWMPVARKKAAWANSQLNTLLHR